MLRTIFAILKGIFYFEKSLIERIACIDEIDIEIQQVLFESGSYGLLTKDLASKIGRYKITRHQISRRLRINKRVIAEFEERIGEKRGWHWALTGFAINTWGETKETEDRHF